ncbi:MAG: gliding motility-associated transporter ATP-binding subunit GldA [Bacteroidota bacterium]
MALVVNGIAKKYGTQTAVDQLSFSIENGSVVGFLGPNGAGKSTSLKIIAGFLEPDAGEVILNGISNQKDPIAFKKLIGYLPESNPLYEEMYMKEYFSFLASIHKIQNPQSRIAEVIEQTGLSSMQHKKIGALSKGYKQRVGIAGAILHKPALILLDEPTAGLDPNQLVEIRALIQSLSKQSIVLFSTHILQEVSAICSSVLVLHQSKLVANTLIEDLLKPSQPAVRVVFEEEIDPYLSDDFFKNVSFEQIDKHALVIKSNDLTVLKKEILNHALAKGLNIQALQTQAASLEEIFKLLTH